MATGAGPKAVVELDPSLADGLGKVSRIVALGVQSHELKVVRRDDHEMLGREGMQDRGTGRQALFGIGPSKHLVQQEQRRFPMFHVQGLPARSRERPVHFTKHAIQVEIGPRLVVEHCGIHAPPWHHRF